MLLLEKVPKLHIFKLNKDATVIKWDSNETRLMDCLVGAFTIQRQSSTHILPTNQTAFHHHFRHNHRHYFWSDVSYKIIVGIITIIVIIGCFRQIGLDHSLLRLLASQSDAHTIAPHRDPIPNPYPSTYSSKARKTHDVIYF